LQFRNDINGLRAIAVIAVVLFHFNELWVPGGFAGVDVFFVISGFLMTGIIFKGIEQENFSILKFYVARANRIIPALGVLCLVLLLFGWFYLTPLDYKVLGKHVGSSMGFLSNVIYWKESGYFDSSSHDKWLLHTWSLSVEWQFYIIYPIVLVVMRKFMSLEVMKFTILLGAILGFIICVVVTYKWPNSAFYLLHARAWEMMIGGVAYLYPIALQEKRKKLLEWVGVALIISSYLFITKETPWPGYLAIFPVLGTFLIIQAQRTNSLITNNPLFQNLGAWSYSIYLWHWPFVVVIFYFSLSESYIYFGIILSIIIGFLSNKYIEKIKFRNNFTTFLSYLNCKPVYVVLVVGLLSSYAFISRGASDRFIFPSELKEIQLDLVMPYRSNGYCFYSSHESFVVGEEVGTNCYLGATEVLSSTLLFGDSYAGHNEPFFNEVFKANNASLQSIVTNWCYPSLTKNFTGPKNDLAYKQCLVNRSYLKENMHKYKNLIFSGSWGSVLSKGHFEDVELLIDKSAMLGINVFIMAAPYRYKGNPLQDFYRSIYFDFLFDIDAVSGDDELMKKANMLLRELASEHATVHFIDRALLYEEHNTFAVNGIAVPYSFDGNHISVLGSKKSAEFFMRHKKYEKIMNHFNLN
jgi:peptidoglycan/LPS O-acetylase OafA/YrhL